MARYDLIKNKPLYSSFMNCEKDAEKILEALFVKTKPYSDILKRLLIINNPDCLDKDNEDYQKLIDSKTLRDLIKEGYVRLNPKIPRKEHENIKSYLLISFNNFSMNKTSAEFRDCQIDFDVICYLDAWCLDEYMIRPLKICGCIDGILNSITDENKAYLTGGGNNIKLSGIGEYKFITCNQVILNEDLSMYSLSYKGTYFSEDSVKLND
jgi:hypothetical protein|nr:MAG TPA: hypothetical protein [Caudoviricetes sp.]